MLPNHKLFQALLLAVALMGLSACSLMTDDERVERTYPQASDFERIGLETLEEGPPAPASYNVAGYVVERVVCPKNAYCFVGDHIVVAETKQADRPEEKLRLFVEAPRQFAVGQRYVLSVRVLREADEEGYFPPARLLGYSRAK